MVHEMSNDICTCTHPRSVHARVVILSGPGNAHSVPIGEKYICTLCLCQNFEPEETFAKATVCLTHKERKNHE